MRQARASFFAIGLTKWIRHSRPRTPRWRLTVDYAIVRHRARLILSANGRKK